MRIVLCKNCGSRVVPKADGRCPSCREVIEVAGSPPVAPAAVQPQASAAMIPRPREDTSDAPAEASVDRSRRPVQTAGEFEIIIPPSRTRALLFGGVGVVFGVIGLGLLTGSPKAMILGILFCLVSVLLTPLAIGKLCSSKPVVIVNREGIFDNASGIGVGWIKWSEIRELYVYRENGIQFLAIIVDDPQTILARVRGLRGVMARFEGSGNDRPPISIPQTFLSIDLNELLDRISRNVDVAVRRS